MHYNFARIHKTPRVTSVMTAGVSDHVWALDEIAQIAGQASKLKVDAGLLHDVVCRVARLAMKRYGLVVFAVRPDFMRSAAWPRMLIPVPLELFNYLGVVAIHAAQKTASDRRISVFARCTGL